MRSTARETCAPCCRCSATNVHGGLVVLFSPHGGAGRTTLAVNLALAICLATKRSTALVDGSLPSGDVAVHLNLSPWAPTVLEATSTAGATDWTERALLTHSSGLHVLVAPATPDLAEGIGRADFTRVLEALLQAHDYVVVDTWPSYQDLVLATLDTADLILVPVTLDVASLKNARMFLQVAHLLGYQADQVQLVANRVDEYGVSLAEAEASLGRKFMQAIPFDRRLFAMSMHTGTPVVIGEPKSRAAIEIVRLAQKIMQLVPAAQAGKRSRRAGAPGDGR